MPNSRITLGTSRSSGDRDEPKTKPFLVRNDAWPERQGPVPTRSLPVPMVPAAALPTPKVLSPRSDTAAGRVMDPPADSASRLVAQKQQRIDILESLLKEFKAGLQDLMRESTQKSQLLQESEERRAALATALADQSKQIAALEHRCGDLEKQAGQGPERDRSLLAFAARQVERFKHDEAASVAALKRAQQARDEAEQFFALVSRPPPRPEAAGAGRSALPASALRRLDRYADVARIDSRP